MSNPFAEDEYGRPAGKAGMLPPESGKSTNLSSAHFQLPDAKSKGLDGWVMGIISLVVVLAVFAVMIVLIQNISPEAPTRLTPETGNGTQAETQDEPADDGADILGE